MFWILGQVGEWGAWGNPILCFCNALQSSFFLYQNRKSIKLTTLATSNLHPQDETIFCGIGLSSCQLK